jgi:hypothetical protein
MSRRLLITTALEQLGGEPLDGSGFEDEAADQVADAEFPIVPADGSGADPGVRR